MVSSLQGEKPTRTEALKFTKPEVKSLVTQFFRQTPTKIIWSLRWKHCTSSTNFYLRYPALFQRRTNRILAGLEGVVCLIDDVLVFTLNRVKCELNKSSIEFLGHIIDELQTHRFCISRFSVARSRTKDTLKFPFERRQHTCITMAMSFVAT